MTRRITCDQCGADIDEGIEVLYPGIDDEGDEFTFEADLCSYGCLATWAVQASIDMETRNG